MRITINQQPFDLPPQASVQDALQAMGAQPPFAVAVNTGFVPRGRYDAHALAEGDKVEIIAPVTGG